MTSSRGSSQKPWASRMPPSLTTFSHILFHSSSFQIPNSPNNPNFVAPRDSCHFCLRAPTCYIFSFKLLNNFSWWGFFWDALLDFLLQETGTSADALWDLLGQKTELVSNLWNPPRRHSLPGLNSRIFEIMTGRAPLFGLPVHKTDCRVTPLWPLSNCV